MIHGSNCCWTGPSEQAENSAGQSHTASTGCEISWCTMVHNCIINVNYRICGGYYVATCSQNEAWPLFRGSWIQQWLLWYTQTHSTNMTGGHGLEGNRTNTPWECCRTFQQIDFIWLKPCHKLPMAGNGKHFAQLLWWWLGDSVRLWRIFFSPHESLHTVWLRSHF